LWKRPGGADKGPQVNWEKKKKSERPKGQTGEVEKEKGSTFRREKKKKGAKQDSQSLKKDATLKWSVILEGVGRVIKQLGGVWGCCIN